MAMVEIVKHGSRTIHMRDDKVEGISVCTRCKGAGDLIAWAGWSDFAIGRYYCCPQCDGLPLIRNSKETSRGQHG